MNDLNIHAVILSVISIITAIYSILILVYRKSRLEREELKKSQAELSFIREKLESQMYAINEKLSSSESRWKDVNHLLLNTINSRLEENISRSAINDSFFKNLGIDLNGIRIKNNQIFLLTPFHNEFELMYHEIRMVCDELGFKVIRGDEEFVKGNILKYIVNNILESRVVIANLSGRNSNVYYELGIAHAVGKPVILVTAELEEVPFDLRNNRLIIYRPDKIKLTNELRRALATFLINEKRDT